MRGVRGMRVVQTDRIEPPPSPLGHAICSTAPGWFDYSILPTARHIHRGRGRHALPARLVHDAVEFKFEFRAWRDSEGQRGQSDIVPSRADSPAERADVHPLIVRQFRLKVRKMAVKSSNQELKLSMFG